MKKKKPNALRMLSKWKEFLADFDRKGVHTQPFPEDIVRAESEDKIVFHAPGSKVVFGTIFKDVPLVIILLIHPQKPALDIVPFADDKARSFLGSDTSVTYPESAPAVTPEIIDARTREVLLMAFPEEVVEQLLSGKQ